MCAAIVVAATILSSCASPSTPTSASPSPAHTAALLEGTWALVSIQPSGEVAQTRPASAVYTLTLTDGRVSTRVDCNMCGGAFSIAGSTMFVGSSLACTRAACPTASFEALYTSILSGDSTIVINGSSLTLTSPRGVLQFVLQS